MQRTVEVELMLQQKPVLSCLLCLLVNASHKIKCF
jgi:hypothetical protein